MTFIQNVVEKIQSPLLLVTMTLPLLSHMTSCLLACDVCTTDSEPPAIRDIGQIPYSYVCVMSYDVTTVMAILTPLLTTCRQHQDLLPW